MERAAPVPEPDGTEEDPLEFEEWDGQTPFWHHCLAGSLAGVGEHVLVYPLDTVKTHIQCAVCQNVAVSSNSKALPSSMNTTGMWNTMRRIVSPPTIIPTNGTLAAAATTTATATATTSNPTIPSSPQLSNLLRLWRGIPTILIGCVPAHALYFSSYEAVKYYGKRPDGTTSPMWASAAGAAAVLGHDLIMSPLDTIKQRLQLGHYTGMSQAISEMYKREHGLLAFYRSFPITLVTNIPYGMVMVGTNEFLKDRWGANAKAPGESTSLTVCLTTSSFSGMIAAASTTPLDRIKTILQTQHLTSACILGDCPRMPEGPRLSLKQAIAKIMQQDGISGFFRGMAPRVASHTPAVAISWTTYETAKQCLFQATVEKY